MRRKEGEGEKKKAILVLFGFKLAMFFKRKNWWS